MKTLEFAKCFISSITASLFHLLLMDLSPPAPADRTTT